MNPEKEKYLPMFISGGSILGIITGVLLSLVTQDFGLWLAVGLGFGLAAGFFSYLFFAGKK